MIDESDIGLIAKEQPVSFSVPSYPEQEFKGEVQQIRLQPNSISNVVMYTVVVEAENPKEELLPGMTVLVDFIIGSVENALLVSNAALRFQPTFNTIEDIKDKRQKGKGSDTNTAHKQGFSINRDSKKQNGENQAKDSGDFEIVWLLDGEDKLSRERIKTGITDGKMTQIIESQSLKEGTKVIIGNKLQSETKTVNARTERAMRRAF